MCSICLRNPCDSRCPNAPEPKPLRFAQSAGRGYTKETNILTASPDPSARSAWRIRA